MAWWEKDENFKPKANRGPRKLWFERVPPKGKQKVSVVAPIKGRRCKLCGEVAPCGKCQLCKQNWECQACHKCRYCDRDSMVARKDCGQGAERGAEREDREQRERWPGWGQQRSAYYGIIGEAPVLRPGDRAGAAIMVGKIERALDQGGWTRAENARLHRMMKTWRGRAAGESARFEVAGTARGGLNKRQRGEVSVRDALINIERVLDGEAEGNIK